MQEIDSHGKSFELYATAPRAESLALSQPVGVFVERGGNLPADVLAVKKRFHQLGFTWTPLDDKLDRQLIRIIYLFQSIIHGYQKVMGIDVEPKAKGVDGIISPQGLTLKWMRARNAPTWVRVPSFDPPERPSARKELETGLINYAELATTHNELYGTNWLVSAIREAGNIYVKSTTAENATSIGLNRFSPPFGGKACPHKGHQTGLSFDIRLPRSLGRGEAGPLHGTSTTNADYDAKTMSTQIVALCSQNAARIGKIFFNDKELVARGLTLQTPGHNDHAHVEIVPPRMES